MNEWILSKCASHASAVACGAVWGFGEAEETCALAGVRPRLWVSMESQNDVHTTEDLNEKLKESLSNYVWLMMLLIFLPSLLCFSPRVCKFIAMNE